VFSFLTPFSLDFPSIFKNLISATI
jgi:hypothetical protein